MDYKKIIILILLIIIPLVLLILCYRSYVYNYCQNDLKCMKNKLIFNLKNIDNKLKQRVIEENNNVTQKIQMLNSTNEKKEDVIEGFFDGLTSWFSGSSPAPASGTVPGASSSLLPISPGSLGNENLNLLEKKINDRMKRSNTFPPQDDLNGNSDDFKDSDNSEVLNSISGKPLLKPSSMQQNTMTKPSPSLAPASVPMPGSMPGSASSSAQGSVLGSVSDSASGSASGSVSGSAQGSASMPVPSSNNIQNNLVPPSNPKNAQNPDLKTLFGSCQFFNDKCPVNYQPLGNFSINGIGNGSTLTCGNIQDTKPAHAIALIKNNSLYEIHITQTGKGFNPESFN